MPELEFVSCFMDYPISEDALAHDGEQTLYDEVTCEGKHQKCPHWGRCDGGKLTDCTEDVMTHAGRKSIMFLVKRAIVAWLVHIQKCYFETVKDTLVSMTTDCFCGIEMDGVLLQNETFPLFSFEKVDSKLQDIQGTGFDSDLLIWLFPAFNSDSVRFGSLIGNDNDVPDRVGLPTIVDALQLGNSVILITELYLPCPLTSLLAAAVANLALEETRGFATLAINVVVRRFSKRSAVG